MIDKTKKQLYNKTAYEKRKQRQKLNEETQEIKDNLYRPKNEIRVNDITFNNYIRLTEDILKSYELEIMEYEPYLIMNIIQLIKDKLYQMNYENVEDYTKRRKIILSLIMEMKHKGLLINPNTTKISQYIDYIY